MLAIINDILDFSKIEANKIEVESIPFRFNDFIHEITNSFHVIKANNACNFSLQSEHLPENVKGDPVRIRQILTNLISNALKFTKNGQVTLRITTQQKENKKDIIIFEVIDDGIGISEEQQKKLFQSFTQADASTTRKYGGTGLGLTISYRLCKLMGGNLQVKSALGAGSTFTASIPIEILEDAHASTSQKTEHDLNEHESNSATLFNGVKALLVDDNNINIVVAQSILDDMGIDILTASNGIEAIDTLKHIKSDDH